MRKIRLFMLICTFLILSVALSSCSRIKSAIGIDRMEGADMAIVPDNNSSNDPIKDPHAEQNPVVSVGPAEEIEKPDSPYYKIGEPMQVDLSLRNEKVSTIFQYTVTDMKILTNLSGVDNITMLTYTDENGNVQKRKLEDYIDENGNLNNSYIYVVADINTKYISGNDEVRDELYHGQFKYDYEPSGKKEIVTEHEDGTKSIRWIYLDENGNEFQFPDYIGGHSSYYYEGAPKDCNHMYLKIGEEINWQVGRILEKSMVEKYGAVFAVNSSTKVQLPIDLSEYK